MRTLVVWFVVVAGVLGLAAGPAQAASCKGTDLVPTAANQAKVRTAMVCMINRARAEAGLKRLRVKARLRTAAVRHSEDMVARGYFSHESADGASLRDRAVRAGYMRAGDRSFLVENIGYGSGTIGSVGTQMKMWMGSAQHRRHILARRAKHLGVGLAIGSPFGGQGATWTTMFGRSNSG